MMNLAAMLRSGQFNRNLKRYFALPDDFVVSNNKLHFIYPETGPPLECMAGDWGYKDNKWISKVSQKVKQGLWLKVFEDALRVL